jgi:6-phosphofructokinase 1
VASGADVILLPEIEYEVDEVARVCRDRERSGQRFTIIAVAEGARRKEGDYVVQERGDEYTDSIRLGGISRVLADQLREPLNTSVRTTVLGHMQRGGSPTAYDRNLATALGSRAAALAADGASGVMVAVQKDAFTQVPLHEIADKTRTVPTDHPLLTSGLDVGTSFGVKDTDLAAHTQPTF